MDDKLNKIHQYLLSQNVINVPQDYNEFTSLMGDDTKANKVHGYLLSQNVQNVDTDFNVFKDYVGLKKKVSTEVLPSGEMPLATPIQPLNDSSTQPLPLTSVDLPPTPDLTLQTPEATGFQDVTPKSLITDFLTGKQIPRDSPKANTIGESILSVPKELGSAFGRMFDDIATTGSALEKGFAQIFLGKEGSDAYMKAKKAGGLSLPNAMSLHPAQTLSTFLSESTKDLKDIPDGVVGSVSKGMIDLVPDILATLIFPEAQVFPIASKIGLNLGKFGMEQAMRGYAQGIGESNGQFGLQLKMPVVTAIERGAMGWMYTTMGGVNQVFARNIASRLLPNAKTTSEILNKAILEHGVVSLSDGFTFGGLGTLDEFLRTGKITADVFAEGFGMGLGFHAINGMQLLKAKGYNTLIGMSSRGISQIAKSSVPVEELNKQAEDKINLIETGQSQNLEGDAVTAFVLKKTAQAKAVAEEVVNNKDEVIKEINENIEDKKVKEALIDKINEVDADNDPRVQVGMAINTKIAKINDALKSINDNKSWSDTMKEVESAPLKEREAELKQEFKELAYGIKPKEKIEGAVEKPKAPQTELSKKLLDEIDKPKVEGEISKEEVVPLSEKSEDSTGNFFFTKKEQMDAFDGITDIENSSPLKIAQEYISSLLGIKDNRGGVSKYYQTTKKINGKDVQVRVSDHSGITEDIDNKTHQISIILNSKESDGITRGDNFTEIRISATSKNIEDKLIELHDSFDDIIQSPAKANTTLSGKPLQTDKKVEEVPIEGTEKPLVGEVKTILNQETDLKGQPKEGWMYNYETAIAEFKKKIPLEQRKEIDFSASIQAQLSLSKTAEDALSEGKYQQAISDGRMTANDAKIIIESAGLKVPKDILELTKVDVPPTGDNAPTAIKQGKNAIETPELDGIHKIGLRALESTELSEDTKVAVKEQGIGYAIRGKNVRQSEAKEYVKLYAEEGQLGTLEEEVYDRDNGISGDTRTALNVYIAKHYVNKLNESTDLTERKEIISHLRKSIAFGQEQATRAGVIVEAQKEWKDVLGENPELSVHFTREKVEKEQAEMFKANEKEIEAGYKTLNDFLKSEEIVKIIDEKVSEEISKIGTKRFGVTDKKKIDDFFEGLKVKTEGKLFDATIAIPITIYNGSIEVIKRSIMAGMDIANAVQAGIDNLDKWHKEKYEKDEITSPEWRKDDYRASLTEKLKPLVKSVSKIKVSDVPKAKYKTLVEKMYAKMPMASKQQLRMLVKNALEELATTGEISKEQFRNELARALGKPHITDAQEMDLFNAGMAMKNVRKKGEEVNKAFDEYEKENAKTNPDKVKIRELKKKVDGTIKEATKAIYNAQKTQKKTDEMFTDTPDWVDTFVTLIKGNLLTIPSLVVNLTSNVGAPLTRVPKNAIASSLDWMISGIAKTYEPIIKKIDPEKSPWLYRQASKLPGSQRTIDFIAYMRGAPRGFKRGIVKGAKQIVTGALPEELLAREINRSLHPIDAAIRLVDMTKGNVPTSVGKYVQAILEAGPWSYNAEFMFRMLNMGDKPFKEPHYIGRLEEIASLKGLTGVAKERFIEQPDEVSEADAKKTADIAVWQNDNAITKWLRDIEKATKHDKSKKDLKQAIMQSTVVRTLARLGLATNAPYVKTPTNIIKEGFEYAVPAYSLLRAAESAYNGNRRQALDFIGKAVVGTIVGSIAANLVSNGLISPPPSKDDKERAQQYDQDMPYMLNVTATIRHINGEDNKWREGDFKVSIKPYGIMSALLMAHVKAYSDVEPSKIKDMSYLDNMAKVVPSVVSSSLDQSFLAGTSVGLTAFIKGGPEMDKYLVSTSRALSSAVYPNNAAILSKTFFSKNFIRETKDLSVQGENVQKQIKNDFKDRMFMGKELPTKVSIWGQKVNRVPDGRNWPYMLFDVTKFEKQQETTFGTKIWDLYKDYKWLNKEDATKLLPSLPSISTEVGWEDRKMTPTEVEEFQMAVGQKRAIYAQHYVDSDQWEEDDNITRGETLTKLYNKARRESLAENFDWDETKKKYSKEWQDTYDLGVIPLPSMGKKFGDKKFSDEDVAMYNRIAADNYMKEIANRKNEFKTKTDEGKIALANGLWKKHIALAKKQVWEGAKASQVK